MAAAASIFVTLGAILQGFADETDIDWNRAAQDITVAASVFGLTTHPKPKPRPPATPAPPS